MRRLIKRALLTTGFLLALLLLGVGGVAVYLDMHLYLRPVPQEIDSAIREQMEAAHLPGLAVAIVKDHRLVFAKGYGYANLAEQRAVTPDTLFQIASVSKLATATALMRLQAQGAFQLDDDINPYLPFRVRNPRFPASPITFRMLLAHTSSIKDGPSYSGTYTLGQSEDSPLALADYLRDYFTPGGAYYAGENFADQEPGTAYTYSNVGFGLVGYLVERLAGQPFDQYCAQAVFAPLGMTATHWFNHEVDKSRWAMPYGNDLLRRTFTPLGAYSFATHPDGALKTSANDFAHFLSPFINQGQTLESQPFLPPATVAEMLSVQYPHSGGTVGVAWQIDQAENLAQHSGGDPGVSTAVAIAPAKRVGLLLFANAGGEEGLRSMLGFIASAQILFPRLMEYAEKQ